MGRKALSPEERKEHEKMWNKKYWEKNKDKINAKRRAMDPELKRKQNRERAAKWQRANREQYNAYQREWRRKRKEANAKAKESIKPCYFVPDEEHPDFETEAGKWWLCDKGEKYSIWRFDSKQDETFKSYLLLRNKDSVIVAEGYRIDDIATKRDMYERIC